GDLARDLLRGPRDVDDPYRGPERTHLGHHGGGVVVVVREYPEPVPLAYGSLDEQGREHPRIAQGDLSCGEVADPAQSLSPTHGEQIQLGGLLRPVRCADEPAPPDLRLVRSL